MTNQSALRALAVLELLAETGPASLATIANRLGLNKSTTHRFVTTLVHAGYVQQTPDTRAYRLTTKLVGVASAILDQIEVGKEVAPVLEETARLTAQTVHLAILEQFDVVYIAKVEGGQSVVMATRVGGRSMLHSTALGKALLAAQPEAVWERYVSGHGLTRRTQQTITTPSEFYAELRKIRAEGVSHDVGENEDGIRCVAAPVRDHTGDVVAAMSVSGWTMSMTEDRIPALVPLLREQAERASQLLGARPQPMESAPDGLAGVMTDS
jgi:DNA-binding IclR family transcriptional regulator